MEPREHLLEAFSSIRKTIRDAYPHADDEPEATQVLKLIDHASLLGWLISIGDFCKSGEELARSVGIARMTLLGMG